MGRDRGKICKFYCASDVIGIRCRVLVLIVQGRVKCQNTEYKCLFVLTWINNKNVNLLKILHYFFNIYYILRLFRFVFSKSQIPPCFNNVNTKHSDVCNTCQYSEDFRTHFQTSWLIWVKHRHRNFRWRRAESHRLEPWYTH